MSSEAVKEVIRFIVQQVMSRVPFPKLPDAMVAMQPYIMQLLQSDVVLNEETRMDIQLQVIRILRKAGLTGADAHGADS